MHLVRNFEITLFTQHQIYDIFWNDISTFVMTAHIDSTAGYILYIFKQKPAVSSVFQKLVWAVESVFQPDLFVKRMSSLRTP